MAFFTSQSIKKENSQNRNGDKVACFLYPVFYCFLYLNFLFPTLFSSLSSSTESFLNYFSLVFLSFIDSELLLGQVKVYVFAICVWLFCKLQELKQ